MIPSTLSAAPGQPLTPAMADVLSGGLTAADLMTNKIKEWRSIVTLLVFVATNLVVLRPFHIPIYLPKLFRDAFLGCLSALRIIAPRREEEGHHAVYFAGVPFWRHRFSMNIVTAPLIADLFLLAILAIGREEVVAGTLGANNISPLDIMAFFITLAYIAISLDATGLIRYLAFKVLTKAKKRGGRTLFFYLYAFFFALTTCIGNDPIILSGTPFLAYMTRAASSIDSPRAWIFTQFAVANIGSAILVSSNPTNLVLAGAFEVRFVDYTANVVVPVVVTTILTFPFLLYVVFRDRSQIPVNIEIHELPEDMRTRAPTNPNIPYVSAATDDDSKLLSLEEILNPYLDKWSASYVAAVMSVTLITVLVLNATTAGSGAGGHTYPVYWCTLPGAFITFVWDMALGWARRHQTRRIARAGKRAMEEAGVPPSSTIDCDKEKRELGRGPGAPTPALPASATQNKEEGTAPPRTNLDVSSSGTVGPTTVSSLARDVWGWARETFPNASHVLALLPWALVPFAFAMFVLVQALVTKGWVPVFAYGWDHWVERTGTVGAVGGMGFLSVLLSNFAGTNIGTTILLSRVIQAWQAIHALSGVDISDRTFWATVYSMALGVNYGAFSLAFSGALAGMLWRDILSKKGIHIGSIEFAKVNLPIIVFAMVVGSCVLLGEVYIIRGTGPYSTG